MRGISIILAVLLAACSAPGKGYSVEGRYGPLIFVLLAESTPGTEPAWRAVARHACGGDPICNIKLWTDPQRVAHGLPMTDCEVAGIEAVYLINRTTGHDGFVCHPFGEAKQRCD